MPSEINQLLYALLQQCKEHQILEQTYRMLVTDLVQKRPEFGLLLADELKRARQKLQVSIDAQYRDAEEAIEQEMHVLPALKRFLWREG